MGRGKRSTAVLGVVAFLAACGGVTRTERSSVETTGGAAAETTSGSPSSGATTGTVAGRAGGAPIATGSAGSPPDFGSGGGGVPPRSGGSGGGRIGAGGGAGRGGAGGVTTIGGSPGLHDAGATPTDASVAPPCQFVFGATTVTANGTFAPRNVAAIWIEDAAGAFVKTLGVWGGPSLPALEVWRVVSNGNRVDAVSGATRPRHGPLQATWNCTGTNEVRVPDGRYQACIAFAEDRKSVTALYGDAAAPPISYCAAFDLSPLSFNRVFSGVDSHFSDVQLQLSH